MAHGYDRAIEVLQNRGRAIDRGISIVPLAPQMFQILQRMLGSDLIRRQLLQADLHIGLELEQRRLVCAYRQGSEATSHAMRLRIKTDPVIPHHGWPSNFCTAS